MFHKGSIKRRNIEINGKEDTERSGKQKGKKREKEIPRASS